MEGGSETHQHLRVQWKIRQIVLRLETERDDDEVTKAGQSST